MFTRTTIALAIAALVFGAALAGPAAEQRLRARSTDSIDTPDAPPPATLAEALGGAADAVPPEAKLAPGLAEVAAAAVAGSKAKSERREPVVVRSLAPLDLERYADFVHQFTLPGGEHVAVLTVAARDLHAVAALPGVFAVDWASPNAPSSRPDHPDFVQALPAAVDPAVTAARMRAAPPWRETEAAPARERDAGDDRSGDGGSTSDRAEPAGPGSNDGWWDVRSGHGTHEAWAMGFKGAGVKVAVLDDAVDFAHADLQGTWATLPAGHPYAGWPQVFDPMVGYLRAQDRDPARAPETWSTRTAESGMIELYQDSPVTQQEISGTLKSTACFRSLQYIGPTAFPVTPTLATSDCAFVVPATSKSGAIRYGHHPDIALRTFGARAGTTIQGEAPGVILVDEGTAGAYDTAYVDVDLDHDFTDEKPMTHADPLGWRDVDGDQIADVSAGLLYFVADGKLPFPASWLWGVQSEVPEAGRMIGILYVLGGHGTLCASNIVSQGELGVPGDRDLRFRDLPGNHEPASTNQGMAPEATIVSIGEIYAFGRAMFPAGWHYAVLGHDVDRDDDAIQVTSNSYGWSDEDNDGWDPDSRLLDYYVRRFAPATTFLFATGNGGPGYGTLAPPMPSVGLDVAASTQFGSTGNTGSITDTAQITYGDVIPFSNRGPGANGNHGPDIAADGAFASGAVPINFVFLGGGNGSLANTEWGGTSRSTPVAAGATALAYQAFRAQNGRWPTWAETKALMQGGARFAGYDTFAVGAGVLDAGDSARIAAGRGGVYALPSEWTAGHYRGTRYPTFAKTLGAGESDTQAIVLKNPSAQAVEVRLSASTLRRIGHYETQLVTDRTQESTSDQGPDYLVPVDKAKVPAGTELMVVRTAYPLSEFDVGLDQTPDNWLRAGVIQHTDIDGDGKLWVDRNNNGVVNNRTLTLAHLELAWDTETRDHDAFEGVAGFTRQLDDKGFAAEIAWYGLGCNDAEGNPPPPVQEVQEKIALIERGTCTFYQKFANAKAAGAIGAVVFTDDRSPIPMGSGEGAVDLPAVMVERAAGLELKAVLEQGTTVVANMLRRSSVRLRGIDGVLPYAFDRSEIQPFEFNYLTDEIGLKNHNALSVHHPLERWSNGLYLAMTHALRSPAVTNTHVTARMDFYAYRPWEAVTLSQTVVTIPPGGEATVQATLRVPAGAPYGGYQGAIFADYTRVAGDVPVEAPGGYELPQKRLVIPVNANVGATYDWRGSLTLGGTKADDRDAPYNNGAVWGTFKWNWRPESGDWRFFFVDAPAKPAPGTFWLFRTTWQDPVEKQSDIDTRVWGPSVDRFSDSAHADNQAVPGNPSAVPPVPAKPADDRSEPSWFGPHTLALLARSTYLALGSQYPFNTSSGANEDWVVAPAGAGLHEVMLHNVLFSGLQMEMPFETTVSSIRVATRLGVDPAVPATGATAITLLSPMCSSLDVTSEMDLTDVAIRSFGMSVPEVMPNIPIEQDDAGNPASSKFKLDFKLTDEAGQFVVKAVGQPGNDLDLFVLYDRNSDGTFENPAETVGTSTSPIADETVALPGFSPPGNYQIWVHGWQVPQPSTFTLTVDVISGGTLQLRNVPSQLAAGQTATVQVCADESLLAGKPGPAGGLVVIGVPGAPAMFRLPVTWWRTLPVRISLPLAAMGAEVGAVEP